MIMFAFYYLMAVLSMGISIPAGNFVPGEKNTYSINSNNKYTQSINQRSSQSHTRAKEKPHPSTIAWGSKMYILKENADNNT